MGWTLLCGFEFYSTTLSCAECVCVSLMKTSLLRISSELCFYRSTDRKCVCQSGVWWCGGRRSVGAAAGRSERRVCATGVPWAVERSQTPSQRPIKGAQSPAGAPQLPRPLPRVPSAEPTADADPIRERTCFLQSFSRDGWLAAGQIPSQSETTSVWWGINGSPAWTSVWRHKAVTSFIYRVFILHTFELHL